MWGRVNGCGSRVAAQKCSNNVSNMSWKSIHGSSDGGGKRTHSV